MTGLFSNGESGASVRAKLNANIRTKLTDDNTVFYVATTGNDTTGDGTVGSPWATPQGAVSNIGNKYDLNGHFAILQLGDGSYAGQVYIAPLFSSGQVPGNGPGYLLIQGNVSDITAVTVGPGNGSVFTCVLGPDVQVEIANLTIDALLNIDNTQIALSAGSSSILHVNNLRVINANFGDLFQAFGPGSTIVIGGSLEIDAGHLDFVALSLQGGKIWLQPDTLTLSGAVDFGAFASAVDPGSQVICNISTITGTGTGKRFQVDNSGFVGLREWVANAPNFDSLPGDATGTSGNGGVYSTGVVIYRSETFILKNGVPAASDIPAGSSAVFRDTGGAAYYFAYNDGGTIKKVALT